MTRTYFIAGNVWLFVSLVLVLGRTWERSQPTMYSFFGIGGSYYPATYSVCVGLCLVAAAACLVLWRWSPTDRNG